MGIKFLMVFLCCLLCLTGCREAAQEPTQEIILETVQEAHPLPEATQETAFDTESATYPLEVSGIPIPEQSFDIELDSWGNVTFASYAPIQDPSQENGFRPDVRFYIMNGDEPLYLFPGWNDDHTIGDRFKEVSAVAFRDYNDDGLLDVITLCQYETELGTYPLSRIYFQLEGKQGFTEDTLLSEFLSKQDCNDSIGSIWDARTEYWDYAASLDGHRSVYNQIKIIADSRDLWEEDVYFAGDVYQYAITDLDHNGRLEIIASNMGGTGLFTYSRFYEINMTYDALVECKTGFIKYDSQSDLIMDSMETYIDENGQFFYVVYDYLRNGAAEHYENTQSLTLKDREILVTTIARRTTIYHDGSPETVCKDSAGNIISEAEYERAASAYFSNMTVGTTTLGWQDMLELADDAAGLTEQLNKSYDSFYLQEMP